MNEIQSDAIRFIEENPVPLLITVGQENAASKPFARYIGPVASVGLDIYFVTRTDSHKVKQMEDNPAVICFFQKANQLPEDFKSVAVIGKASRLSEEIEFNRALDLLGQKSAAYRKYIEKEGSASWAMYKVTAASLDYTDFSKSKKTVKQVL
jgi:general stress protein 26